MKTNCLSIELSQREYYDLEGFCWGILNHHYFIKNGSVILFIQTTKVGDIVYNDEEVTLKKLAVLVRKELGYKHHEQLNIELYRGSGRIVGHYTDECTKIHTVIQSLYPVEFYLQKNNNNYSCNCKYVA